MNECTFELSRDVLENIVILLCNNDTLSQYIKCKYNFSFDVILNINQLDYISKCKELLHVRSTPSGF